MTGIFSTKNLLLAWGILAVLLAAFSAYDSMRTRAHDGAIWLLGGEEIRIVGIVPSGAADVAGLQVGDVIEGIGNRAIRSPQHASTLLKDKRVGEEVSYLFRRQVGSKSEIYEANLVLGSTRITDLSTYLVYCILGLIYFLAGFYVFFSNPSQLPARLFYLLCTLFLLYFFAASERSAYYYWSDVVIRNIGTGASLFVPPVFLHFFLVFPQHRDILVRRKWLAPAFYILPTLYYADFTYTQFFGLTEAKIGAFQQISLGFYFTAALASLVSVYLSSADAQMRQRVKFLTLGTVWGTLPFLIFNIALAKLFGRQDFALLGAVPMVLVPVSFGYSIARYRLMDIEVIIRRSLIYAVLTGVTVGSYLLIVVLVGNTVLNLSGQSSQLVAIIATLLIAAAFSPAKDRIQSFLERRFFREKHDLQQALQDLSKELPRTLERETLENLIRDRITSLLHPDTFEFLGSDDEGLVLNLENASKNLPIISKILHRRSAVLDPTSLNAEVARLSRSSNPEKARDRAALEKEIDIVQRTGIEVIVPSFAGERLVGALGLGAKKSEAAYDGDEKEILQIVAAQMGVQLENTRLYDEAVQRQRLEKELAIARSIQQRLLPSEVPKIEGLAIAAINLSSSQVSGDYFDFISFESGMGFVLADVAGKGMPASLLASNLQASIRALCISQSQPGAIMAAVNSSLYESTDSDRFATAFMACHKSGSSSLIYSNAGHNPPLLRRANGDIEWLEVGSTPLGAFPDMDYPETKIELHMGDILVMFTDGVTEAENAAGEFFDESGLEKIVQTLADADPDEIVATIKDAVCNHSVGGNPADDMTLIVLKAVK